MPAHRKIVEQWGTVISIDVGEAVGDAIDRCIEWFARVDDLFSTWRADTEIMRIGRGELACRDASPEVRTVLAFCEQMRLESGGAFDISVGERAQVAPRPGLAPLDPSGVVKGWAVARAGEMLRDAGASNFFINAGGDILTAGRPDDAEAWRVGVRHPWLQDRVAVVLQANDLAVATSGPYERGDHIFDPRTGRPAAGLASVTVVGPDLAIADAYATAAVALGRTEGMRWMTTRIGYQAMGITDDQTVVLTPGFNAYRAS